MHEYSIVRALVDRVEAEARKHQAVRVRGVRVLVGELSGVDADLLRTAFDACRPGTNCASATIDVVDVPVAWQCPRCSAAIDRSGPLACPACGVPARLAHGDELNLDRIEMEVGDV